MNATSFSLLGEHHLLVFNSVQCGFQIFPVDPAFTPLATPTENTTPQSHAYGFALPSFDSGRWRVSCTHVPGRSRRTPFPDCKPHFEPDAPPSRALVAFMIVLYPLGDPYQKPDRAFILLIPVGTILSQETRIIADASGEERKVVPWEEWGPPDATTLAIADPSFKMSVCGSRALLVLRCSGKDNSIFRDVHIVDAHPYAALGAVKSRRHVGDNESFARRLKRMGVICIRDHLPDSELFPAGQYPCRLRHRRLRFHASIDENEVYMPYKGPILTDDTFGFAVRSS